MKTKNGQKKTKEKYFTNCYFMQTRFTYKTHESGDFGLYICLSRYKYCELHKNSVIKWSVIG